MDRTDTDRELLRRLHDGDTTALEMLLERPQGLVRVACQRQIAGA